MEKYTSASVRLKNGKWQARLRYKDNNGKWKNTDKMLPDAKGKREASKMAEDLRRELNAVEERESAKDKTVTEVFMNYLKYQFAAGMEASTYDAQITSFKCGVQPFIGDYNFYTLSREAIIDWQKKMYDKGLEPITIYKRMAMVSKVYKYYVDTDQIPKNPFDHIKMKKQYKPKVTHLTDKQMDDLLTAAYLDYDVTDPMFAGILLAYYSGLRRGEICGLRWVDIDLKAGTLTVSSAIGLTSNGSYTKHPKNKASERTFPMVPQLINVLKQIHKAVGPDVSWFVIGNEDKYMSPRTFSHKFSEFVERNNLTDAYGRKLTPHMLRHNMGYVGAHSGMDISSLSRMFGHANRAMTLNTYGDDSKEALEVAMGRMSTAFKERSELEKDMADGDAQMAEKEAAAKEAAEAEEKNT